MTPGTNKSGLVTQREGKQGREWALKGLDVALRNGGGGGEGVRDEVIMNRISGVGNDWNGKLKGWVAGMVRNGIMRKGVSDGREV